MHHYATARLPPKCIAPGFTLVELICTIVILLLLAAGVLKINDTAQEREKYSGSPFSVDSVADNGRDWASNHFPASAGLQLTTDYSSQWHILQVGGAQ